MTLFGELIAVFGQALLPPVVIAGVGAVAHRILHFDLHSVNRLSIYIFTPALMFTSLLRVDIRWSDGLLVLAFCLLVVIVMSTLGSLYAKLRGLDAATRSGVVLSASLYNALNLGFPVVLFAFGEDGLALAAVVVAANTLPHHGFGAYVAARGTRSRGESLLTLLRLPILYAIGLALAFRGFDITVPSVVLAPLELLAKGTIPVLLVTIGMELGRIQSSDSNRPDVWGAVLLRLLVGPLVAWGVSTALGLTGLLRSVVILQASMPTAIIPIVYAREFGGNVPFVSRAVVLSTVFGVVSVTVVLRFLK